MFKIFKKYAVLDVVSSSCIDFPHRGITLVFSVLKI